MRIILMIALILSLSLAAMPARADAVQTAFDDAIAAVDQALPHLEAERFGVDIAAYRDALNHGRFASRHWGGEMVLALEAGSSTGGCARFAAYVPLPPRNGTVALVVCPQFSSEGTPELRRLTILHEMVHVVAGPDECRAMAFAAHVEFALTGRFTPVDRYWQVNRCETSAFRLP